MSYPTGAIRSTYPHDVRIQDTVAGRFSVNERTAVGVSSEFPVERAVGSDVQTLAMKQVLNKSIVFCEGQLMFGL